MLNIFKNPLFTTLALCCLIVAVIGAAGTQNEESKKICNSKQTCRECIRTPKCLWCQDADHGDEFRCFSSNAPADFCKSNSTVIPEVVFRYKQNDTLTQRGNEKRSYDPNQKIVQIWPQRVQLDLRINEPYRLEMRYTRAADYPIDLYFLMDLSSSMKDDKDKLSVLGEKLAEQMRKMTSDFRLGFGSFVDKTVMPFVSTIPKNLKEPCEGCAGPYGFRNHMSLTTSAANFSREVKKAKISANLDAPEGGLDALMQAIVCSKEIGWRDQARRLIVFATDANFHLAGDGRLGGIIEPNDCECHLNKEGYYTMSTEQDYPSIGQVNRKVKESSINVIFAVTADQNAVYTKLKEAITGSKIATLSKDSSNVVQLVENAYEEISSSIEMVDNATSHVKVTYYSACKSEAKRQTSKCDNLKIGDEIIFDIEIVATACPKNPNEWTQSIEIKPTDIKESLIIELKMHCACDCESASVAIKNSPQCSSTGTYMCGICDCGVGHRGKKCECSAESLIEDSDGCKADKITNVTCNNVGSCVCNECKCNSDRYSGKFCECDSFTCESINQQLCSGADHGSCDCGQCVCLAGWEGSACQCMKSKEPCMPPNGGEICSGHGECECGECKCDITDTGRYSGKYCENCPTCSGRCQELKSCVQCQMYETGPLKNVCSQNCTSFKSIGVDKVTIDVNKNEQQCMFYDEDDCRFTFKYAEKNDIIIVEAQRERECLPKALVWKIVFSVIGATVLVGLATLLLWKMITTIHDRREFTRFEKERMKAKWETGANPLYKEASSTFKNPTFSNRNC